MDAAIAALPPGLRRKLIVTCDGAGASHDLIRHLDKLASRRGYELTHSVGWVLGEREKAALRRVPAQAWQLAIDGRGEIRERRADDACASTCCAHRACWIEEAHVTELTGLLRPRPCRDQLKAWPAAMRVFARRERPHPAAQLTLFEAEDGRRYSLWATNRAAGTRGWLGQNAYIDGATGCMPASRMPSFPGGPQPVVRRCARPLRGELLQHVFVGVVLVVAAALTPAVAGQVAWCNTCGVTTQF